MNPHLIAAFDRPADAERAFHALTAIVDPADLSLVVRANDLPSSPDATRDASSDPITDGTLWGSGIGALAGAAFGLSALLVPGVGPVLAMGPLLDALAGAMAGGALGALVDLRLNRYTAERIEEHLKSGRCLVTVGVRNPAQRDAIVRTLREHGATEIHEESVLS